MQRDRSDLHQLICWHMSGTGRDVPTRIDISQLQRRLVGRGILPENRDDAGLLSQDLQRPFQQTTPGYARKNA